VSNVFLTGGNMQYPGMKQRVERELLAMRPFQSHFKVQGPFCRITHSYIPVSANDDECCLYWFPSFDLTNASYTKNLL